VAHNLRNVGDRGHEPGLNGVLKAGMAAPTIPRAVRGPPYSVNGR
jgi:hypothetical protein